MPDGWSDAELRAAVDAYLEMQRAEAQSLPVNKRQIYEELARAFGRSNKAFEYRMQNISAVLDAQGRPWIAGLKPAKNVGASIFGRIERILASANPTARVAQASQPAYKNKLPAMRSWLIGVARNRSVIRYGELMQIFDIDRFSLRHALSSIGHQSRDLGEPILTALVVSKRSGRCSSGLEAEFDIQDDALERARLYVYWEKRGKIDLTSKTSQTDLEKKARRFAQIEVRPDQAAFREAVFVACLGRCVVTGCDIPAALDAAHRTNRDWRLGHNKACDGFLLRKDLHALYDRGFLKVSNEGAVSIDSAAASHYGQFNGMRIRMTPETKN